MTIFIGLPLLLMSVSASIDTHARDTLYFFPVLYGSYVVCKRMEM